jgi:hypothetical protein
MDVIGEDGRAHVPTGPPPPPAPFGRDAPAGATGGPGQLTAGWQAAFVAAWVLVMIAFGALARAGRISGISPWWLGPETEPRPVFVMCLPFLPAVVAVLTALRAARVASYLGVAAALATMAFALGDLHFPGIALAELAIGGSGLLVSLASFGGRTVRPRAARLPDPTR